MPGGYQCTGRSYSRKGIENPTRRRCFELQRALGRRIEGPGGGGRHHQTRLTELYRVISVLGVLDPIRKMVSRGGGLPGGGVGRFHQHTKSRPSFPTEHPYPADSGRVSGSAYPAEYHLPGTALPTRLDFAYPAEEALPG